ncbi:helix-turn-helix domain-containing protein [Streptomyces xanthochromogenes]|uniref:helix-turn-helix domain-containing protein n=1 Tax=Streptomyces xanthochromogenes TaxID=67384 RepID=UPI001675228D|nr:helix-turn-helix transcriptional regulator [Streptomyces xanthochromogenes]
MARPPLRKICAHAELRRLRTERGTTRVELARVLGISTSNGPVHRPTADCPSTPTGGPTCPTR